MIYGKILGMENDEKKPKRPTPSDVRRVEDARRGRERYDWAGNHEDR